GTIEATRWVPSFRGGGRNKGRFEATLFDGHQRLSLVWFNGRHMSEHIEPGVTVWVQGKIQKYEHYLQMVNPKWKRFSPAAQSTQTDASCDVDLSEARLQPIYPATEMLNSQAIEKVLHA